MLPVNNATYAWIQHFIHHLSPVGVARFVMAKTTRGAQSCSMRITEDVRKYLAQQGVAEALKIGLDAKSNEFDQDAEIYSQA